MFNSHTDQQKKAFSKRYIASAWKRQRIVEQNDLPAEFRFAKESSDGVWRGIRWDNRSQTVEKLASDNGLPERAYECGNDGNDRQNNVQAGEKKVLSQERQHMHVRRERSQPQEMVIWRFLGASKLASAASVAGYRKGMFLIIRR